MNKLINYYSLKDWLLKAVNLQKDHTGLVLVERVETHSKTGTVYRHKHWVKPDEVLSTDKVLRGHHNLPSSHPQKLTPMSAARLSVMSKKVCDKFASQFSDHNSFYKALTAMEISWKKNPLNDGVNFMWAKMGLRAVIDNGFDLNGIWNKIKSLVSGNDNLNTPNLPNSQLTNDTSVKSSGAYSKAVKQARDQFAAQFVTHQEFYDALGKLGIEVKDYNNDGIKFSEWIQSTGRIEQVRHHTS